MKTPYKYILLIFLFVNKMYGHTSANTSNILYQTSCEVSETEKQALLDFYNATDGSNWKNTIENNKPWDINIPVCDWYGVTVSNGKVVTLRLSNNNLAGYIPSEIEGVTYLQNLTISGNENLSGQIPVSIGKLTNLKQLSLYGNPKLSGGIPKEIGNLINLTRLTLNQNNLTGTIPVELGNLSKMSSMLIRSNKLTGIIPKELAQIDELWELFLDGNQLTGGLPPEIGRLSNLRHLSLSNNKLTGTIPVEYKGLIKLTYLALSNNKLSGVIPSELFNLQLLEKIYLDRNTFEGSIPSGISELSKLERLIINNNNFKGKIPIINSLVLEYLYINYNDFVFSDIEKDHSSYKVKIQNKYAYSPQDKVDQSETKNINTGQSITLSTTALTSNNNTYQWYKKINGVTTAIPGATSKEYVISNATTLDAGDYYFRATNTVVNGLALERHPITLNITEDTCGVSEEEKQALLDLYNATNGANWKNTIANNKPWDANTPVCDWYGVTVANGNVIRLKLENNELKGLIPKSLQNLTKLNYFNLNENRLTGSIPVELGRLSSLTHLQLKGNQLNENIPIELADLQNLVVLHLSNNKLRGYIPKELSYLKNLKQLALEHNILNGSVPKELSNLSNLEHLSLNSNQLSGVIAAEFSGLVKLRNLAIANNQFVFSDFEKEHLTYKNIELYLYSPQAKVDQPETKNVITGQSITLSTTALTSNNNTYQWYKTVNGVTTAIPGATSKEYVISSITATDQGIYHFLATNSVVNGLTLERHPITLNITEDTCGVSEEEKLALWDLYTITDGPNWKNTVVNNKPWSLNTPVCDWFGIKVTNGSVTSLQLVNNNLIGVIPIQIERLISLKVLSLEGNKLTGSIPKELANLKELMDLRLSNNELTGSIPKELGSMNKLETLILGSNQLTGMIPLELGNLPVLRGLWLMRNNLEGTIPASLGNISSLTTLLLSDNNLLGSVPSELGNLTNLQTLWLSNNQLGGRVPPSLSRLSLGQFRMSHNAFVFHDFETEYSLYNSFDFYYIPQAKVDQPETKNVITGQSITLSTTALTSNNNTYQWYKTVNGVTTAIPGATSKEYVISSITATDQGIYHFLATNSVITDLTLERHPITITIKDQNNCSGISCEEAVIEALNFLKDNDIISFPQVEYTLTDNPAFFETCVDEFFNINSQDTLVWKNINGQAYSYALQLNGVSIFEVNSTSPVLSHASIASFSNINIANVRNEITYLSTDGSLKEMPTKGFLMNCTPKDCVDCPLDTTFCLSGLSEEYPLVEYLVPQGEHITWYLTETGGTAINKEEFITTEAEKPGGITYWWEDTSDTINTRTPLTVMISDNVPVVEEFQSFPKGMQATIGDLQAEGDNVQWYALPVGGTPLSIDTILEDEKTYFAERLGTPCRAPVIVSIGTYPPEGDGYQLVCEGTTLAELEQTLKIIEGSTIKWYDQQENGSELPATTQVENGVTYYAAQVDIYGDISEFRKEITVNVVIVSPPFVPETLQTFYKNKSHTIADLLAIGYEIRWYDRKIGGTVYADSEELINGQVYYAEQRSEIDCPGIRQGVQVRILEEEIPELFGCEKFKPKAGDRYVVNGWVREQGINRVNPDVRLFNDSKESKMFVELLNHLKNRIIDTDPDIYYIPELYIPQSATQNLDFDPLLAYVNDTQIEERKLTVYGLTLEKDAYGRTIGFSFALNKNRTSRFTYLSPKVRRKDSENGTSTTLTYRYPIRDNKDNMTLTFTDVRVENGQFYMISNFSMLNAGSDTVTLNNLKDNDSKQSGINAEVTFYQDEEISEYQPITYLNTLVKIAYKDANEGVMDTHGLQFKPQGPVIEGWQQISGSFTIPVDAHQMTLSLENTSSDVNVYFDDIRFHPYDGNMKTFVYDPATQRLMSELDENNFATFYEYDAEGGLVRIKKETERGVFTIQESRSANTKATK